MGGYGSGRWDGHTKKIPVEDCQSLDAGRWAREGILREGVWQSGGWEGHYAWGEKAASIDYEVNTTDPARPLVRLAYTVMLRGEKQEVDEPIRLQTTRPHFGGMRWWFTCPLVIAGRACRRRVRKLYRPPGGKYFGCRHCYDLTYRSVQEHDSRVDALLRAPERLERLLESDHLGEVLLGLRAAWKMAEGAF
jgi:hypothetical protein